jgi:hypothetical protein
VPKFIRSFSQPVDLRSTLLWRVALAFGSTVALWATFLLAAAPAGAIVTKVETGPGTSVTVGLQPRSTVLHVGAGSEAEHFANPVGEPVLPSSKTYAVYWDPTDHYHGDWQEITDTFMQNMGTSSGSLNSVFAVDAQYTDAANQHADYAATFMGAYTDTDPYPTAGNCTDPHPLSGEAYPKKEPDAIACLTSTQVQNELKLFVADHSLPKGMGTIFYLLTPPGVTICLDGGGATGHCSDHTGSIEEENESYKHSFCSYHSDINPDNAAAGDPNTILYAAIPWTAGGLADGHLASVDQTTGYACQDGGFDPSSKPIEEAEHVKTTHTPLEEEEFANKNAKEKREQKEAEEKSLESPHPQEPNQVPCPSDDGYCDAGLADLIINQIAVEQQDIVTDPLLDSWKDPSGNEATDECRNFFAPTHGGSSSANPVTLAGTLFNQTLGGGSYYLNNAFNLAALKLPYPGVPCLNGISLDPKFTAPNPVNSGEIVGFDGMESDITLNQASFYTGTTPSETYAKYSWNFGDGTPTVTGFAPGAPTTNSPEVSPCPTWLTPCAASAYHSYQYGGTYDVTLTVTDTGGNTASVTEPITVAGAGPPAPPSPPSGGGSSGAATTAGTAGATGPGATGTGPTPKPTIPGPVASQAAVTRSLSSALSKGLVISYSVNEQVAGQFQVLLASSIAKRIGLHGPQATGMPPGSAPSIVIGKAILITTKGGRNTVKIQFGKKTAAKLRKLRSVQLTVRLVVRNASHSPLSTTVISTVNLSR